MRIAGIKENDIVNGEGVCVSVFVQGCPHRCKGCFNPETWDFESGIDFAETGTIVQKIIKLIRKNGVQRNFSILGGEPLCPENIKQVFHIIQCVRNIYPNIKIFVWTGYTIEELIERKNLYVNEILKRIDYLIDGRFIEEQKDITLKWRGSRNQRILTQKEIKNFYGR